MDWILSLAFWTSFSFWCYVNSENDLESRNARRRFKRIILGLELSSQDQFHTQYMVALRKFHGCENALLAKETYCVSYEHKCGGSLIAPDFVLTACHCIVNEIYHVLGALLPPFDITFDGYTSSTTTDPSGTVSTIHVDLQPLHPILNYLSLWMGGIDSDNMAQRQFAKTLIPHRACTIRDISILQQNRPELEKDKNIPVPTHDIGVVRTWEPFVLSQDVKLIPMKLGDDLLKFHRKVMKKMPACLFIGWGQTEIWWYSPILRHAFRHSMCTTTCLEDPREHTGCDICTTSIARPDKRIKISEAGLGDSGGPLMCDDGGTSLPIGVLSRVEINRDSEIMNSSNAVFTSIVCVRGFLTPQHLQYIREEDDNNGKKWIKLDDVPMGPFQKNN